MIIQATPLTEKFSTQITFKFFDFEVHFVHVPFEVGVTFKHTLTDRTYRKSPASGLFVILRNCFLKIKPIDCVSLLYLMIGFSSTLRPQEELDERAYSSLSAMEFDFLQDTQF